MPMPSGWYQGVTKSHYVKEAFAGRVRTLCGRRIIVHEGARPRPDGDLKPSRKCTRCKAVLAEGTTTWPLINQMTMGGKG